MPAPSESQRKWIAASASIAVAAGAALFGAHWLAKSAVVDKAGAAGVSVARSDVEIGLDGSATLRNLTWASGSTTATVESVEVVVALSSVFSTPRVERVVARGVEVRHESSTGSSQPKVQMPTSGGTDRLQNILARIGGTPPEVVVERVSVRANLGADRLISIEIDEGSGRVDANRWQFLAPARLGLPQIEGVSVPSTANVAATMDLEGDKWLLDAVSLRFDSPVQLERDGRSVSVGAVGLSGSGAAMLGDVTADLAVPWFSGPAKIRRIEAGPLRAIVARDRTAVEFVRVSGADVTLEATAREGSKVSAPVGWNARLAALLGKAFTQADEARTQAQKLGHTKLVVVDSTVRVPRFDSEFTIRDATLHEGAAQLRLGWARHGTSRGGLRLAYGADGHRADVVFEDLELAALDEVKLQQGGHVSGTLSVAQELGSYPVHGKLRVDKLRFASATLATAAIEVAPVEVDFALTYTPGRLAGHLSRAQGVVVTSKGRVKVGEVVVDARPAVFGLQALPDALPERVELELELPQTPVQQLVAAIPAAVLGPLQGMQLSGNLGLAGRVELPLQNPERMKWELEPTLSDFQIVSLPNDVDVRRLMTSATYTLQDEKIGHKRTVFVPAPGSPGKEWTSGDGGCGSYVYVPLHEISPHLPSGVLSTEDRGFLWHNGFNVNALRESLAANIAEGRIVRGGSTITMQLVKNLFLDRSKTVARKLREVFLVWLTESVVDVPKSRLLEVYLNVIEYGPKIQGIFHASTYFFGKRPRDLTVGEAAWFITTLTGPKIYHHQFLKREISEGVWGRMRVRIDMLYENDYITELDLVVAKARRPAFRAPDSACAPRSSEQRGPTADEEALAYELLRLRRSGVERSEVLARLDDPIWRAKTLAAPRAARVRVEWDALPLARDGYGWWRGR